VVVESWTFNIQAEGRCRWRQRVLMLLASALLFVSASLFSYGCAGLPFRYGVTIRILHINDLYDVAPDDEGIGGVARLKTLVDEARREDASTLLIVSGDFLSPSLLSSQDKGNHMVEALNMLQTDYVTIGNHDLDFGADNLKRQIAQSRFKWIASNVMENGGAIPGAYYVDVKRIKRVNVGFLGLLDSKAMDSYYFPKQIDALDPVEAAKRAVKALRRRNAEVIVAITHMDASADMALAENVPEIDLILGGHDHLVVNQSTRGARIFKSGYNASHLGKVAIFTRGGKVDTVGGSHVKIDSSIPEDPQVAELVTEEYRQLNRRFRGVVGKVSTPLDATSRANRTRETSLGDFITDAMRETMVADAAIINGGAIRSEKVYQPGAITKRELNSIMPFGNVLCKVKVMGYVIKEALEHSVAEYEKRKGAFLQMSGMRVVADLTQAPGARIKSVHIQGSPLDEGRVYTLALNDYLLQGGDGYSMFGNAEKMIDAFYGQPLVSAVERFIKKKGIISPKTDGRITILGERAK